MFRPTVGELLSGITDSLRESVMPAVSGGAAQRQLKAALHTLGRLQRSWDRWPAYLEEDNEDIRQTLDAVLSDLSRELSTLPPPIEVITSQLKTRMSDLLPGAPCFNDRALSVAGARNLELQGLLVALDDWLRASGQAAQPAGKSRQQMLDRLYRRMTERELQAWAIQAEDD